MKQFKKKKRHNFIQWNRKQKTLIGVHWISKNQQKKHGMWTSIEMKHFGQDWDNEFALMELTA